MSSKTDSPPATAARSKTAKAIKNASAKPEGTQAIHRPDMDTLVKTDTIAETMDLMSCQSKTDSVSPSVLEQFEQDARPVRAAMKDAIRQEGKSRGTHARSLALAHPLVRSLCEQPELVWVMLEQGSEKVTERTLKSPCLPAIKALYPDLDRREQSSLAQIHNHAMACGWSADELCQEVQSVGSVELIKRERQRQRLRAGDPAAPSPEEIIAGYRDQAIASPVCDVCPPKEAPALGLALAIVEFVGNEVVVYDIDTDEKRVLAAVKSCAKRGRELRVRSASGTVPEAAE